MKALQEFGKFTLLEQIQLLVWFGIFLSIVAAYVGLFLGVVTRMRRWITKDHY